MKKLKQLKNAIKGKNSESKRNLAVSGTENCAYSVEWKENADEKFNKLHQCCLVGDEVKVRKYVKKYDVNCQDSRNRTPIHLAAAQGYKDIVMVLLENRADIEVKDCEGQTPLMKAVENGHADLVGMLIGYGVNINTSDNNGNTSLHLALEKERNNIALVLLHHNAAIDIKNADGKAPLHIAAATRQLNVAKTILQKGAVVDVKDKESQTPLIIASKLGSLPLASLLIEHGADPFSKDSLGKSAVDYSNMSRDTEIAQLFISAKEEENIEACNDKESSDNEIEKGELDFDVPDSWNDSETTESSKVKLPIPTKLLLPDDCPEEIQNQDERDKEQDGSTSDSNVENPCGLSHSDKDFRNKKGNEFLEASVEKCDTKFSSVFPDSIEKINQQRGDLFADLGFSDSIASDESSSSELTDDQKSENREVLMNSPSLTVKEKENCSTELLTTNKNLSSNDSRSEINYEPYVPSVTRRRSSCIVGSSAVKRHPLLSERAVSLDISHYNEDHNSFLSENSLAAGTEVAEALEQHTDKTPVNTAAKIILETTAEKKSVVEDSESDWDSDDSGSVDKNQDCHGLENQTVMPLSPEKEEFYKMDILKDKITEQSSSQTTRANHGAVSQNISDKKDDASFHEEAIDHWSTLGRPGTLQGCDEIWENNPRIKRSPSENKSPTKFLKQNLPVVSNKVPSADEDSSTTITDTEEGKIKKPDSANSDLNDPPDDTLSISTDEELFQEDGCNRNNALHCHTLSPSELVTLQATVREQRLALNRKNDKITSLKRYQKTLQQEKADLREKLRKTISSSGLLKNTILDLKNQLSNAEYSLQEEKQNRENAEALLNAMKEKVSHKHNLYINENKLRRSLEGILQSEKDSASEVINLLQAEVDRLSAQVEQEKKMVQEYEKRNTSLQLTEKSVTMLQAELDDLNVELEQQKMLVQKYKNKNTSLEVTKEVTNMKMGEENELKLELERMRKLLQVYENRFSVETADKSTSVFMVDLNDEISKLSEEIKQLQNENQKLVIQLQLKSDELQVKQYELDTMEKRHNYELKNIEAEKEDLERKAQLETDNERLLRKELEDMTGKIKNLNLECEKYRQSIDALHKAVTVCQTSEEVQNTFSSYLEKLKLENTNLELHLNEIRELHSLMKDVALQGKIEALDIFSSIKKQLETTLIELEEKSTLVSNLQSEVKQKQQYCFEKDLMIKKLEQEKNTLKAESEVLHERLSECEKKANILQTKFLECCKPLEVHTENNNDKEKEDSVLEINALQLKNVNLEKELMKEQQYSATLGTTIDMYKQNENALHMQIQTLKAENQELKDKLYQEKDHSFALHFKLNAFNEIEEELSQKIKAMEKEKLQFENEIQKARDCSNTLDNKQGIFTQNLKKMEELISNLQTAKQEIESKRIPETNEVSDGKAHCSNCDVDSVIHLIEKLKDMEHLKNEKEALVLKEKRKTLKALKSKKITDSQLQKEKQRVHQLMDVISDLKLELETANKKMKDLENFSQTPDQKQEQDDWKSRANELNAQIEQFRQEAEKEYSQRKEIEATCSLLKTELNSLRTVQTTLIEELLNELKSVKSQSQEQAALTCQMESWYKRAENVNNETIYNVLRDISHQVKKCDSSADSRAKVSFTETKQKLMKELSQLKSTMKHKEYEYEMLEGQRNRLHQTFKIQRQEDVPYSEEGIEVPVKLPNEARVHNAFSDSAITSQRWSTSPVFVNSSQQVQEILPQPISPIRSVQHFHPKNDLKSEDDSSNNLLPEIQMKLDNAIAKHLNSAPRVDISIASHHNDESNSANSYMSALQKRYFV